MTGEVTRIRHILGSGQSRCYTTDGHEVPCPGTGQDGDPAPVGLWPVPRFVQLTDTLVRDRATELIWPLEADLFPYPLSWQEGLAAVRQLNREGPFGRSDWRMPNRRELRSLISHGHKKPALPPGHPFGQVFLGWYWTSTSFAGDPAYAWAVHLEGGRMFYGRKDQDSLVWPVCGSSRIVPRTGQSGCFDQRGREIACAGTGQDGELAMGWPWPEPRFSPADSAARDNLTGLVWYAGEELTRSPLSWEQALAAVRELARSSGRPWRLPTINELESLVDASRHAPALPADAPFSAPAEGYWSSTTSFFDPAWAYVLYLQKGGVGVGLKKHRDFWLWPVF